jgi:hypothetical protein
LSVSFDRLLVTTDPKRQHYMPTVEDSIRIALNDGETDIDDGGTFGAHLVDAYKAGGLNMTVIRRALFNTFRMRFRLGLFDPPEGQKWTKIGMDEVSNAHAQQLNRETARQSLVLLQNKDATLPFKPPTRGGVVVIGGSANSTRLLGGGHYARAMTPEEAGAGGIPGAIRDLLASNRILAQSPSAAAINDIVSVYPGIACTARGDHVCADPKADAQLLAEAVAAAEKASQVVIVANLQGVAPCDTAADVAAGGEYNPCGFEGEQHDRPQITLPKHQE